MIIDSNHPRKSEETWCASCHKVSKNTSRYK